MEIVRKIGNMLKITAEVILVIGFIFFEELIWKKLALPIKDYLTSLEILQKLQIKIESKSLNYILGLFVVVLTITEVAGIYAGLLIVQGAIIAGVILYAIKVGFAGFTFWMFSFTKDKLLTIDWFKTVYDLLMRMFNWIKATRIYRKVQYQVYRTKRYLKNLKAGTFKDDVSRVYMLLVQVFSPKPEVTKGEK